MKNSNLVPSALVRETSIWWNRGPDLRGMGLHYAGDASEHEI